MQPLDVAILVVLAVIMAPIFAGAGYKLFRSAAATPQRMDRPARQRRDWNLPQVTLRPNTAHVPRLSFEWFRPLREQIAASWRRSQEQREERREERRQERLAEALGRQAERPARSVARRQRLTTAVGGLGKLITWFFKLGAKVIVAIIAALAAAILVSYVTDRWQFILGFAAITFLIVWFKMHQTLTNSLDLKSDEELERMKKREDLKKALTPKSKEDKELDKLKKDALRAQLEARIAKFGEGRFDLQDRAQDRDN